MHLHAELFDHALQAVLFDDALCLLRRFLRLLIQTLAQVFHLFPQLAIHSLGLSLLRIRLRFFLFQLRIFRLELLHDFLLTHGSSLLVQVKGPALYSYRFLISIAGGNKVYLLAVSLACALSVVSTFLTRMNRPKQLRDHNQENTQHGRQESTMQHSSISSTTMMRFLDTERIQYSLPVTLAMLCWFVIPLVVSYGVSLGSIRLFSTRYLVIIVPPLLYLAALGIETLSRQRIRTSLITVLFVLATFCVPVSYQSAELEDWKQATFWLQSHHQAHDGMACYDNAQGCQLDIEYYLRAYPHDVVFPADSPGSFPWVSYDLTNQIEADTTRAVDPTALAVYGTQHPRLFFVTARLANEDSNARAESARRWLGSHYHLVDQIVTRTVTIRLYQTTHSLVQQQ